MPIYRVHHYYDGLPRFLEESVLKDDHEVVIRSSDVYARPAGGPLKLIVLSHFSSTLSYKAAKTSITLHKFIVMDGSKGVFVVHMNSSLTKGLRDWTLASGCTLICNRWNWIWCKPPIELHAPAICRGVLMVHDYTWRVAPDCSDPNWRMNPALTAGDHILTTDIKSAVLEYVREKQFVA